MKRGRAALAYSIVVMPFRANQTEAALQRLPERSIRSLAYGLPVGISSQHHVSAILPNISEGNIFSLVTLRGELITC
ncbi:MAG: hypothetical protein LBK43_00090 [Treponema sp.]|nr:hypothetical protein [Treponema sp.]